MLQSSSSSTSHSNIPAQSALPPETLPEGTRGPIPLSSIEPVDVKQPQLGSTHSLEGPSLLHLTTAPSPERWLHQAQLHSILIFAAIWGLLTRLGLTAIGTFDGQNVFSLLLVQVLGCLIMGASIALQTRFNKIHPLLYLGMTTGYCGSVTTFSSWMSQVFMAFMNASKLLRSRFSDFLDGVNLTYVTIGLCLSALQTGFHVGNQIERRISSPNRSNSAKLSIPFPESYRLSFRKMLPIMIASIGPMNWIGSIFIFILGPTHWRGAATYSVIISPTGTLLRYYLAKLNLAQMSVRNGFPIGTYLANLIATGLLALFTLLQYTSAARRSPEYCAGLQGLKDGFCGCLSTISTFFFELYRVGPTSKTFTYALISWASGQLLFLFIFGIYSWTHGLQHHCSFPT